MEKRSRRKKKRKGWRALGITLAVLIVAGGGAYIFRKQVALAAFDMFLSGSVEKQLSKSYVPLAEASADPVPAPEKTENFEPLTALLLGVDQREDEPARSDTMIYTVFRPEDGKVLLISIPRDTYVELIGKEKKDKITHAYAFGGAQMAKDTVEHFLDAEIEYYAAINFNGLKEIVDALGGVALPISKDIVNKQADHEKFTIKANQALYNGVDALNYVRYREDSDFERTKRHQVFLNAITDRLLNLNQISKIPDLIEIMGNNFKTDLPPSTIIDLSKKLLVDGKPLINSFTIMGEGTRIKGIYYDLVNEEDLSFAKQMIESWTNPDTAADQLLLPDMQEQEKNEKLD